MDRLISSETTDPTSRLSRLTWVVTGVGVLAVGLVAATRGPGPQFAGTVAPSALAAERLDGRFWDHWGDGKAELDGYRLVQPRYGEAREGTAVHIFVTEPFSRSAKVKADPGRHPPGDVLQVLKLNEIRDFQTGMYDYNLMTSVFASLDPDPGIGRPLKLAFSGQEWCGMVYEELRFEDERIDLSRFSYFDGESRPSAALPRPAGGLTVDELPIRLRGILAGAPLAPGETLTVPLLPSTRRARLRHRPLEWGEGQIRRAAETRSVEVPAGRFEVVDYEVSLPGSDTYRYRIEAAYPHRVVAWEGPEGERAELAGSARLPYWELNGEGQGRFLTKIGLDAPQGR